MRKHDYGTLHCKDGLHAKVRVLLCVVCGTIKEETTAGGDYFKANEDTTARYRAPGSTWTQQEPGCASEVLIMVGMGPYTYETSPVDELKRDYPEVWATVERDFPFLSETNQARIVSLVIDTCPYCHQQAMPCHCANDE